MRVHPVMACLQHLAFSMQTQTQTHAQQRYFHTTNCPEMPEDAEAVCHELVADHRDLLEEVLRTPPFITCPADWAAAEEEEDTAEARR